MTTVGDFSTILVSSCTNKLVTLQCNGHMKRMLVETLHPNLLCLSVKVLYQTSAPVKVKKTHFQSRLAWIQQTSNTPCRRFHGCEWNKPWVSFWRWISSGTPQSPVCASSMPLWTVAGRKTKEELTGLMTGREEKEHNVGQWLTQTHGCLRASWAVILLDGLMVSIWLIRFLASGVTVSHSGEGNWRAQQDLMWRCGAILTFMTLILPQDPVGGFFSQKNY